MKEKNIGFILCIVMLFFVVSCASLKNDKNTDEQFLKNEMRLKNNTAREIQHKSVSYALIRSKSISVQQSDLFGSSSALILRVKEIPAMETRLRSLAMDVENYIKDSSEQIANEYVMVFYFVVLTKENYALLDGVNNAYTDYLLAKYQSELKQGIRNVISSVKQTSLYKQWQNIYDSYDAWRTNTNNLALIAEVNTFPVIDTGDIEEIITSLIYNKWVNELRVGEQIAKAERESRER